MNNETFRGYVSRWLDGSLTEGESAALQSELEKSRERRDEFVDLCGLDADLRLISDSSIESINGESPPPKLKKFGGFSYGWMGFVSAIAAALLLVVGYGIGRDQSERAGQEISMASKSEDDSKEAVETGCAVVSRLVNAKFPDGTSFREGDSLRPGRLKLVSGGLQLDFFSGATILIEDAAELDLVSAWEARCLEGKVTVHVPPPAIGFRLLAPGMKVIDLGTEFGVRVEKGESSVHVFDGEVEAYLPGSPMQIIRDGESLDAVTNQAHVAGRASPGEFPSVDRFEQRRAEFYKQKTKQWWTSMKSVRADERIVGCYLFWQWEEERWDRLVNNFAVPKQPSRAGSAVGARWVEGRWPTKSALDFKSAGDRVRINLGDEKHDGLSLAAWIRVDGLDRNYNALLMSDGNEEGAPDWQIDRDGRLAFSVNYSGSATREGQQSKQFLREQTYHSPPVIGAATRRWQHVAVTFDALTGEAIHYLDGEEVSKEVSEHHRDGHKVTFGRCEIGNWGLPPEGVPYPIRNFNGRIDEFVIYGEPLAAKEIASLYQLGVPD
ncbi:LamG-like jellyroll fold domain-containing protein [Crateriforma conspicua]|uniref:FecR protein n=1 Tax=Crateriforma conspicua TaxID=2527996 RepID=A0A5C5Y1V7_9PLAN|nr:LamG-like jellyroll fold domain-containing protein [Crateriforma conspicua]TWT68611.1 FecR protein [Crateriforma conspicua]